MVDGYTKLDGTRVFNCDETGGFLSTQVTLTSWSPKSTDNFMRLPLVGAVLLGISLTVI